MEIKECVNPVNMTKQHIVIVSKDSKLNESLGILNKDISNFNAQAVIAVNEGSLIEGRVSNSFYRKYNDEADLDYFFNSAISQCPDLIMIDDLKHELSDRQVAVPEILMEKLEKHKAYRFPNSSMIVLFTGRSFGVFVSGQNLRRTLVKMRKNVIRVGKHHFEDIDVFLYADGKRWNVDLQI